MIYHVGMSMNAVCFTVLSQEVFTAWSTHFVTSYSLMLTIPLSLTMHLIIPLSLIVHLTIHLG